MNSKQLLDTFNSPGNEWRGKPFWSWNGKLDKNELIRQIHVMKEMGMGGYFMHSRTGLATEYLGDEWFDLINACTDEGEKLDLEVWLYDEDRWPSGLAGGLVTKDKKYRERFIHMTVVNPEDFKWDDDAVAIFICELKEKVICTNPRQIFYPDEAIANTGESYLIFKVKLSIEDSFYNGTTYIDTMNPEATEEFIRVTHEKYKEHCGEKFGKSIKGIFTDEPRRANMFYAFKGQASGTNTSTSWTDKMPEEFKKRMGYELIPHLPELFLRVDGNEVAKIKWDFVEVTQQLFLDNYAKICQKWCTDNNLIITGHILEEGNLVMQTAFCSSAMRYYEFMDYPGMDELSEGSRKYWVAKQLSSVGRQTGKKWLLSELYGCTGWQVNFQSHKEIGDWQTLFGVNLRCHHLSWYTMKGEAKRDYPASILHQSGWWKDYNVVETYFARLGVMLNTGDPCRDLLVIHPIESAWSRVGAYTFTTDPVVQDLEIKFREVFDWLASQKIDFDYGDEEMVSRLYKIRNDENNNPILDIGEASYRGVLVAGLTTIRKSVLDILKKFSEAGGKVVFAGEPPEYVNAEKTNAAKLFAETVSTTPFDKDAMTAECAKCIVHPVEIYDAQTGKKNEKVFCQLRKNDDEYILTLLNTDLENKTGEIKVSVKINPAEIVEWDCLSGDKFKIKSNKSGEKVEFITNLDISGSKVFVFSNSIEQSIPEKETLEITSSDKISGPYDYSLNEPNICVLDFAEYKINGGNWQPELEILKVDQAIRKHFDIDHRGGDMIQPWYRDNMRGHAKPVAKGKVSLAFSFNVEDMPNEDLTFCMEEPQNFSVKINGSEINFEENPDTWIDICFKKTKLPVSMLNKGKNRIDVETDFHEEIDLEAIYIFGNFGVKIEGKNKSLTTLPAKLNIGCITTQGLPFYSGAVRYNLPLEGLKMEGRCPQRPNSVTKFIISAPENEGALIKVFANDEYVGCAPWSPYEIDITDAVNSGSKTIELEVVLTRRNTFGPLHLIPLRSSAYGPGHFITGGESFSENYMLYPAGLLAPPVVSRTS